MPFIDMMPTPLDVPLGHVGRQTVTADETWLTWFLQLVTVLAQLVRKQVGATLVAQAAAIGTTPMPLGNLSAGLYRISYYARIHQAASSSSSLAVTLGWVDGVTSASKTFPAVTGNTLGTVDTNSVLVRSNAPGVLTYATAYASVGGTPMQYSLDVTVERLSP